jgi:hypothetical protein
MDKMEQMETRLWDYIDGLSNAAERSAIEKLVAENMEWKEKYGELLSMQELLQRSSLEEPSMRFTKNVMDEIARLNIAPATKNYINNRVIWGIGAFFILLITTTLIYALAQIDWSAGTAPDSRIIDFTSVDYSKIFSNTYINIFMMVNIVLGLMLLDRYLANKRAKWINE